MKSLRDDINQLKIVGMFVILFLICTSVIAYFLGTLNDITTEMGIPSFSAEFAALEYIFGFAGVICIAGATYFLFKQHEKKKKFEEGN